MYILHREGEVKTLHFTFYARNIDERRRAKMASKKKDIWKIVIGYIVLIGGFVYCITIARRSDSLEGIGIMGLGIFLVVLVAVNLLSNEWDLTSGEIRKAITVSYLSVFMGLLMVGNSIQIAEGTLLKPLLENFWWIVITIIGFYFGGRTVETIWGKRKEDKEKGNS
ncbi:MAG: hypothetical protein AB1567_12425 [bacterium]